MAVDMTMAAGALVQSPTDMVPEARLPDLPNTKQPSHSRSQDMSAAGANGPRRRRPSKSVSGISLKRSASTPTVRGVSGQTDMPLSLSAEKRRNKLGYHRTSVACGMLKKSDPEDDISWVANITDQSTAGDERFGV